MILQLITFIEMLKCRQCEKGSLAMEYVIFIGAIAVLAGGVAAYFGQLNTFLTGFTTATPPTGIGG